MSGPQLADFNAFALHRAGGIASLWHNFHDAITWNDRKEANDGGPQGEAHGCMTVADCDLGSLESADTKHHVD